MAQRPAPDGPTRTIAAQVAQLRRARGWSGQQLAEALAGEGVKWDRSVVANFENGRRRYVSVQEWLALARVLGVAPIHLLVPLADEEFQVTPETSASTSAVRAWVRGYDKSLSLDPAWFDQHWPVSDPRQHDAAALLRALELAGLIDVQRDQRTGRIEGISFSAPEEVTHGQHREAP